MNDDVCHTILVYVLICVLAHYFTIWNFAR
jgi:hypothetical protein